MRSIKPIEQSGKFVVLNGKKLLNLSSNDYLGISADVALREEFLSGYKKSISIPSARLLSGTSPVYNDLEDLLAQNTGREKALLFNSGYHANVGIYSSLAGTGDVVFCDKLNHASIIDGIKLGGAKLIPFKHLNYEDLREKLKKYRTKYKRAIISTESLFSMDGDFFDLNALVELKREFDCLLIVDEAHTFGVFGYGMSVDADVDLIMGTFGKAVGSYGAFCASSKEIINHLINHARPFIFSTAFPQISAAFAHFVLTKGDLPSRAEKLHALTKELGVNSHIVPVICDATEKSEQLIQSGFYVLPIRYPTVPKNASRVRISLNSLIEKEEVIKAFKILGM